jgi:hypothetical protein
MIKAFLLKLTVLIGLVFAVTGPIFASDVSALLVRAHELYEAGDLEEAKKTLLIAKEEIDALLLDASSGEYEVVENWSMVKINPKKWEGRKVKVVGEYFSIDEDSVNIINISGKNQFITMDLAEKIAALNKFTDYVWYGEIILTGYKNDQPALLIEDVE